MRVDCEVDLVKLAGDYTDIDSVRVTCSRCAHSTESFGTTERSIKRCLVLLREECPEDESNFYVCDEAD